MVHIWIEPHDSRPRARLVSLGPGTETTVVGIEAIELEFGSMLRTVLDATDA